jgi:glycosyltransferase involved in cell wall biosynthesis
VTAAQRAVKPRVLLVATHPIQYQIPLFQALALEGSIDFSVLFVQQLDAQQQGVGFNVPFKWDIPLTEGYAWTQVPMLRGEGLKGFFSAHIQSPGALLKQIGPDVVILTGWQAWPLLQMLFAARLRGVRIIMRGESNGLRQRSWYVRALHRLLLANCAAFLPIGKANRKFYKAYGRLDSDMFDAGYFVDNERFIHTAAQLAPLRARLRAAWQVPEQAICFCYAGKLEPKKRILDLLQALKLASTQAIVPIYLLVVGTGELMDQARAMAKENDLPVTFAGFLNQTEMPSAYVASDCLVLPSDFGETWGLVVNEAMACGRPALVSDRVGCNPDLIITGKTGETFPFGDIHALSTAMVALASDRARLISMGVSAREHVVQEYSVAKAVEGTLAAVNHVLRRA